MSILSTRLHPRNRIWKLYCDHKEDPHSIPLEMYTFYGSSIAIGCFLSIFTYTAARKVGIAYDEKIINYHRNLAKQHPQYLRPWRAQEIREEIYAKHGLPPTE
eukprot:TRINITY_DN6503_c0_g1_i1.p1 TRINITY_DN6503_c0_g1~~TRINITY_DN6503_c0_g1_i1.p1  ORF type:complete len:103 (+),score=0.54 TRINITY_DN6503_c0_g1_i1:61-369(+)